MQGKSSTELAKTLLYKYHSTLFDFWKNQICHKQRKKLSIFSFASESFTTSETS